MRKLIRLTGFLGLLVAASLCRAGEAPMIEGVDGKPENFEKGDVACYGVWHQKDAGWHLAVTTAGHRHHFKGKVWIEGDGHFKDVNQWKGEGEKKAEKAEENWFHKDIKRSPEDKPKEITFDIVSESKHVCGLNFHVEGKGPLKWSLWIGGEKDADDSKKEPKHVKIGKEGKNPSEIPFQTMAHPDEKGHGK